MDSIEADPEDIREILNAAKLIRETIIKNNLSVVYVMEALQGLYASQARDIVSYEVYCKNINTHKNYYKILWQEND